ncbi:unnamed protein product [Arabidopsis lyrata]|uniref:Transmembrane protein 128 n=3 Tax=Arabidopsis TaxID=3701 RepID=D7LZF3_ARALL|nr:uncharacterized protein LOC9310050 [Arabidopsis lyrata subsp. lyrata]EFH48182.1 hypothetical protein ARALYDRAFT_910052 [Arabidopsis lyrata subsp. lyrata]KAG7551318.1 hypothetical protein ISN45_Aa06g020020 [Arabidopsis thaliana x Arabidopsis arenosa]CAE6111630.1 unnamed protein product [Arabidopsis arenosa]CAH8271696.1 unnamed protein product [Arabidopsis lyrata]|eukprot:XP_002871923.1 uncharacterized protein LOC9310050 [Arabidopsis lyrata subsp. lyrata]
MSGGTPVGGGGYIRQRHSQGYASGGDDLEDDACSRPQPFSLENPRSKTWVEILENVLWIASAVFIVYFGDRHSNMIHILLHDARIKRMPLYFGMLGIAVNIIIIIYESMLSWSMRRFDEKWELWSISALPFITLLGLISFGLLSFALWPIWGFLTLPLLFTLFMACLVVFPHLMIIKFRPQNDELRID